MLTTQVVSSKVDWSRAAEALLVAVLAGLVFAVHDVPWVLSEPFWNDENWVVVSTRLPLADVPSHTSTTPIGFTLLLRTIRWGGDERFRLLPLLFSSASVVAAYALARAAGWRDRREAVLAGVLAGGAALLVPTALVRNDLKQYTAEAFAALFVLVLCARVERDRSPRSLAVLAGACLCAVFLFALGGFNQFYFPGGRAGGIFILLSIVSLGTGCLVVWFLRPTPNRPGTCPRCGYDLTGIKGGPCPECGGRAGEMPR